METASHKSRVRVFDTTLRDGEQAPGCHMKPEQKLIMAQQLHRLGVDIIEAGFPISSPADFEAVRMIARSIGREETAPVIAALARSVKPDIDTAWKAVQDARFPRLHTFLAASDIHLEHKLHMSHAEALKRAVEGVRYAKTLTSDVQFSPEDGSRADRVFLAEMVEAVIDAGATTVNIPDTVGYAVPEEFGNLIRFLFERVKNISRAVVSVHCHDDLGLAVANTLAAVKAGARQVEGTVNGIGERAGNCALDEVVMGIRTRGQYYGVTTGVRTRELVPTSRCLTEITGVPTARNKAVVGENAFAHASGIHQDGMMKDGRTYEIMSPEEVGAGESRLPLTARSGRRALEARMTSLGFAMDSAALAKFFQRFKAAADQKPILGDDDLVRLMG
jgi:2-isopropylmalate synthase